MRNVTVKLDTINRVKEFVQAVAGVEADIDIKSGRYLVDAKSIMGILSLDLTQPLELAIDASGMEADLVVDAIKDFVVTE